MFATRKVTAEIFSIVGSIRHEFTSAMLKARHAEIRLATQDCFSFRQIGFNFEQRRSAGNDTAVQGRSLTEPGGSLRIGSPDISASRLSPLIYGLGDLEASNRFSAKRMNESDDLLQLRVLSFRFFRMGMSGSAALRSRENFDGQFEFRYCGNPTLRISSVKRGSERKGSSKKSIFKPIIGRSRSR